MITPSIYRIKRELMGAVPPDYAARVSEWFDKYVVEIETQYSNTSEHVKALGADLDYYERNTVIPRLARELAKQMVATGFMITDVEQQDRYRVTRMTAFFVGEK